MCGEIVPEGRMVCPICEKEYSDPPAMSRIDGSAICPTCGTKQALDDARFFIAKDMTDSEWDEYKNQIIDTMRKKVVL